MWMWNIEIANQIAKKKHDSVCKSKRIYVLS